MALDNDLDDRDFERLIFDLLAGIEGHHNVKWLTHTNAPDRGRDLSLDRSITTPTGETRFERVVVQAKHWRSRSIAPKDLAAIVAQVETWGQFQVVIVATSGRFTSDGVQWAEVRGDQRPEVVLWGDVDLERLLTRQPALVAAYGLR